MLFLRGVISWLYKNSLTFFLLSFFLIKIPPFYLFFPIKSALLTTHSFSRLIILVLFVALVLKAFYGEKITFKSRDKTLLVIFVIYFFFQSISIIGASNVASFLQRYKDIIFSGFFLFMLLQLKNKRKKIIDILFASSVFNFFYQMLMFFSPGLFREIGETFVYQGHLELVNINLERARIFIETYDEIAIPFLFILMVKQRKSRQKALVLMLFLIIAIPSLLSNFRSRVLMLVFVFFASFFVLAGKQLVIKLSFLASFLAIGYVAVMLLNVVFGFSFLDRFALQHKQEDVKTIELRFKNIERSVEMGVANPVLGVGLGNYYDNLPDQKNITLSLLDWRKKEARIASTNPHNIFAQTFSETGIPSLIFYFIMVAYFFAHDLKILWHGSLKDINKGFIISFWTLFIYSIFNPTTTLTYNSLFWILRGLI